MNFPPPLSLIISSVYYLITILMAVFSLFGIYLLIRYGRSLPLSITLAAVYSLFFLILFFQSHTTLINLLS